MATVSRRVLVKSFVQAVLDAPEKQADLVRSLVAYLIETKQLKTVDLVLADIQRELAAHDHVAAQVTTAHALTSEARQAVQNFIQAETNAQQVELTETLEPSLIGGLRLTLPHHQLDTSVKKQLQQLKSA